jgi:hypothetical protein
MCKQIPGDVKDEATADATWTQLILIQQGLFIHLPSDSIPTFLHHYWFHGSHIVVYTYSIPSLVCQCKVFRALPNALTVFSLVGIALNDIMMYSTRAL